MVLLLTTVSDRSSKPLVCHIIDIVNYITYLFCFSIINHYLKAIFWTKIYWTREKLYLKL